MNIFEKDKEYIAGTYNRFPVHIVSGQGSVLKDINGKEYIDMGCGIGVTSFGIADEEWQSAVIGQIGKVQHTSNLYYTEPCVMLAEQLCLRTGMKKVFFSNSGAEANECAIKVARKYAYEKRGDNCYTVVTLKNSFHGRTLTTLAATGQEHYHELFRPLTPGFVSIESGDINALENLASEQIAAVMIECVQGEGGVLPVSHSFADAVGTFCRDNDILLIVDEVQTGNGRSGMLYSYMNYGLHPDIVSTAKGLAGGLPLGATLLGDKVQDVLGFGDHGSTFGGNPVCCAAAISVLSRIDDGLLEGVRKKSAYMKSQFLDADGINEVTGLGLLIGLKTIRPAGEIVKDLIKDGVLCLTAKDRVRLMPALNIPDALLKTAVEKIKAACRQA
ncbi:MAG: acetylornithine/succinylornithine family transaminase [Clostridia bacterium]|nr:acetylornithine/succinylornithine family transaminase [Clostridia bacterium]